MIAPNTHSSRTEPVPPDTPDARELARRLIAREAGPRDTPDIGAKAAQLACERVYRDLSRWIGGTGCYTLFTRAVVQAQPFHPLLSEVRFGTHSEPRVTGTTQIVETHGAALAGVALESLLTEVLDLLGRLIGGDVTARLVGVEETGNDQGPRGGSA
ncbi:MAG: hypothetical protein H0T48_14995 [Gemmatimonadaceae bacterium]|nr:hypothetical protein [Gemmatimonadaceae bacterium]